MYELCLYFLCKQFIAALVSGIFPGSLKLNFSLLFGISFVYFFQFFYSTILLKGLKFSVLLTLVYFGSITVQKFKVSIPKMEAIGFCETSSQITLRNIQDTSLSVKPQTAQ
jgi:hypothetical protein